MRGALKCFGQLYVVALLVKGQKLISVDAVGLCTILPNAMSTFAEVPMENDMVVLLLCYVVCRLYLLAVGGQ